MNVTEFMVKLPKFTSLKILHDKINKLNSSRLYGIILYTSADAYVVKMLRDDAFWNAIDSISGSNWPVFAAKPPSDKSCSTNKNSSIPREPEDISSFLESFSIDDFKDLPCFVTFIWDDNDELQSIAVPIKGNNENATFDSIKKIVEIISEVEKQVEPQYKQNVELFRNVKQSLESYRFDYTIKSFGKRAKFFFDFLKSFIL